MKQTKLPDYLKIEAGVATIDLLKGLKIGERVYHRLSMRQSDTGDLMDAEDSAPTHKRVQFNMALAAITLTGAVCTEGEPHSFDGPFSLTMLRRLHPIDSNRVQDALYALDAASGEE